MGLMKWRWWWPRKWGGKIKLQNFEYQCQIMTLRSYAQYHKITIITNLPLAMIKNYNPRVVIYDHKVRYNLKVTIVKLLTAQASCIIHIKPFLYLYVIVQSLTLILRFKFSRPWKVIKFSKRPDHVGAVFIFFVNLFTVFSKPYLFIAMKQA